MIGDAGEGYDEILCYIHNDLKALRTIVPRRHAEDYNPLSCLRREYDAQGNPICSYGYRLSFNGHNYQRGDSKRLVLCGLSTGWVCRQRCLHHPTPDVNRDDPAVPNMVRVGSWSGFGFALGNTGDEVLLLDTAQNPIDVVTYGTGSYLGVTPHPGVSDQGHSLERRSLKQDTDDCSQDLYDRIPPTPGELPE